MPEKKNKPRRGKGEGGLYFSQARDEWVGSFYAEDGKRKYVYGKKRSAANTKLQKALREDEQGALVADSKQTVKQYLEHWLENVHKPKLRLVTYTQYRLYLDKHILPAFGHLQLRNLTPERIETMYAKKQQEGLSPGSIRLIHAILHKALDQAVRRKQVVRNVCNEVSPPRLTKHEIQPLTQEQAQQLLKTAKGHRLECLLTMALTTGMRKGELLSLRWHDIDLQKGNLQVRRTVKRITGHGYVETEPKTQKSKRNITIPSFLIEMLKQHRTHQLEARLMAGVVWQENDLVFCNRGGGFLDSSTLYHLFEKLLKDAGLPHMRFHDLRHSAATILLSMGVNGKVIQELLGHSNITMTLGIYSHVLPSMQKEAMEKWDDLFGDNDSDDEEVR